MNARRTMRNAPSPLVGVRGAVAALLLCACSDDPLNRMAEQPRARVYRTPPAGTVPRERNLELEQKAPPYTLALLEKGRRRYDLICATCHGLTGEADTVVAGKLGEHRPPSLHDPRVREKTDEHLFTVIGQGSEAMPAFPDISLEERWGVVAYVRALQLSQRVPLEQAPEEIQTKLKAVPR